MSISTPMRPIISRWFLRSEAICLSAPPTTARRSAEANRNVDPLVVALHEHCNAALGSLGELAQLRRVFYLLVVHRKDHVAGGDASRRRRPADAFHDETAARAELLLLRSSEGAHRKPKPAGLLRRRRLRSCSRSVRRHFYELRTEVAGDAFTRDFEG